MKKVTIVVFMFALASCARHNLNYQSQQNSGYQNDNTPPPAPQNNNNQTYNPPPQNNNAQNYDAGYNNNNQQYVNYNGNGETRNDYYPTQQVNYNQPTYQTFYDELGPYGNWVNYGNYGYVWVPNAGPGFSPYCSNGHWVYTDMGWTWASNYSWGWAPFHYGRWAYDDMYGWLWVPGNQWAPAWVTWDNATDITDGHL